MNCNIPCICILNILIPVYAGAQSNINDISSPELSPGQVFFPADSFSDSYNHITDIFSAQLGTAITGQLGFSKLPKPDKNALCPHGEILLSNEKFESPGNHVFFITNTSADISLNLFKLPLFLSLNPVLINTDYSSSLSSYSFEFNYAEFFRQKKEAITDRLHHLQIDQLKNMIPDLESSIDSIEILEQIRKQYGNYFSTDSLLKYSRIQSDSLFNNAGSSLTHTFGASKDSLPELVLKMKKRYDRLMGIRQDVIGKIQLANDELKKTDSLIKEIQSSASVGELKKVIGGKIPGLKDLLNPQHFHFTDFGFGPFTADGPAHIIASHRALGLHGSLEKDKLAVSFQAGSMREFPFSLFSGIQAQVPYANDLKKRFLLLQVKSGNDDNSWELGTAGFLFKPGEGSFLQMNRGNVILHGSVSKTVLQSFKIKSTLAKSFVFFPGASLSSINESEKPGVPFYKSLFAEGALESDIPSLHTEMEAGISSSGPFYYTLGNEHFRTGSVQGFIKSNTSLFQNKLSLVNSAVKEFRPEQSTNALPGYKDFKYNPVLRATIRGKLTAILNGFYNKRLYEPSGTSSLSEIKRIQLSLLHTAHLSKALTLRSRLSVSEMKQVLKSNAYSSAIEQELISGSFTLVTKTIEGGADLQSQFIHHHDIIQLIRTTGINLGLKIKNKLILQNNFSVQLPGASTPALLFTHSLTYALSNRFSFNGLCSILSFHTSAPAYYTYSITAQYSF